MDKIESYLKSDELSHLAEGTKNLHKIVLDVKLRHFCSFDLHPIISELDSTFQGLMPAFVQYLKNTGCTGKTIQSYITILKQFFKAIGEPIEFTYKLTNAEKKETQEKNINKWFSELDVALCLHHHFSSNQLRNKIIVRLLYETGIRVNELANIKLSEINILERNIKITKSKTQIRYVFISQDTCSLLKRYLTSLQTGELFGKENPDRYLLNISSSRIQQIVKKMLIDLGIDECGRGCHTFRHWCATYLFYAGNMRIEDVATLLGDTVEMILSTYLHPTPGMLRKKVSKAWGW